MINCDAVKQAISKEMAADFCSEIMLSYSLSTNNLYNILHFVEFGVDPNYRNEDELYERKYHVERSNRRLNRIAARLKVDRKDGSGATENCAGAIFEAKYYDSIMHEGMVHGYNRIAQLIDRPKVKVITDKLMRRACVEESAVRNNYNDHLVECGYCIDIRSAERNMVTLPEAIFYTAIYMSTNTRSLFTLNRSIVKNSEYNRTLHWYEHFIEAFKNRALYEAIIWEMFDMLFEQTKSNYEEVCDDNILKFWLDEKYRNRKDRTRALKKLSKITYDGKVSEDHLNKQLAAHPERGEEFFNTFNRINILEMLLCDIIPYAEMIALGRLAKPKKAEYVQAKKAMETAYEKAYANKNDDSLYEEYEKALADYENLQYKEVASWLADIVCRIVKECYGVVEEMLQHLPEAIAWKTAE